VYYLGGKTRLAKRIVDTLPIDAVDDIWEPFMGGGSITGELSKRLRHGQRLFASDAFVPLIAMWTAAVGGFDFPECVTEVEYREARLLPDTHPLKAFIGFGCSFGGRYYEGYARNSHSNYCSLSKKHNAKTIGSFARSNGSVSVRLRDFLQVAPCATERKLLIYCDPPYAGTTRYSTGTFDHDRFWSLCREWRRKGALVYVSEFSAPEFARPVLVIPRKISVVGTSTPCVDTVYEVLP
jgi:DNA adenine methylase